VIQDEHSRAQEIVGKLQGQADELAKLSLGSIGGFEQQRRGRCASRLDF
jgi:hypothetical protein